MYNNHVFREYDVRNPETYLLWTIRVRHGSCQDPAAAEKATTAETEAFV